MSNYPYPAMTGTAQSAERERAFIRSVYAWMFGGLMITAAAALWVLKSKPMQDLLFGESRAPIWILFLAQIGLVMYLSFRITKMSPGAAAASFLVYSLLSGMTLSSIFFVYTGGEILNAFLTAGGMFAAMSVYGMVTKRDLTSWGSFFFMGLIGLVLASVVNFFLKSPAISWAVSVIGVFVFVGLTAYDTQKLKAYATAPELRENLAVYGALALYLDFINLFLMLLRLFGGNRR